MMLADPFGAFPHLAVASLDELDEAIATWTDPQLQPTQGHALATAYARAVRFERNHDPATLDRAQAEFDACTYRGPERGVVARALVMRRLMAAVLGRAFDPDEMHAMVTAAGDDPVRPGSSGLLHGLIDAASATVDDSRYDRAEALGRLDELHRSVLPESELGFLAQSLRMALSVKRGHASANLDDANQAAEWARTMLAAGTVNPGQRRLLEMMAAAADGMAAVQSGDLSGLGPMADRLGAALEELPPGDPATASMGNLRDMLADISVAMPDGTTGRDAEAAAIARRERMAREPGLSAEERAFRLFAAAMTVVGPAIKREDPAGVARAVGLAREAVAAAPPGYPNQPMHLTMLGRLLCVRYQLGAGRPALDEAMSRLREAVRLAAHPGHLLWSSAVMAMAHAYRLSGLAAESRIWGRRALRGHAWKVLLQAGTKDASTAARDAIADAAEVAGWCIADGDFAGAAGALDAGRGLMLYAATVATGIPDRLAALGRHDLRARWAEDHEDADLRIEVLTALTGEAPSEASVPDVLDPPPIDEMQAAVRRAGADALVYLMPGGAILVPAEGRTGYLALPQLVEKPDPVRDHLRLLAVRDAGEASGSVPERRWRDALDDLCGWAWRAAVGPLVHDLRGRLRTGRRPRMVLIPIGALASVPWHAARDADGNYAIQYAVFSYAPSARLFGQDADSPDVPDGPGGLIVGDPTGDLPDARAEAVAIRDAFRPAARVLDGSAATRDRVLAWLRDGGADRSLLHLACHGAIESGVDGSYLLLAGRERLTAPDILRTRRTGPIGLVALAACTTGVPSGEYDEAFSLSTAFLVAGARTVYGSLWPVPGDATSLLMFMAHHYRRAERLAPVEALNKAQVWMLDPDRETPAVMPPALSRRLPQLDHTDITGWAGFTHLGR